MNPDSVQVWFRVLRDVFTYALGAGLLLYEFVLIATPNPLAVGVGVAAIGLPPILRINERDKQ